MVHLDALAERFPRELSGGQQQRVGLARAIVYRPTILLLDEPLSNLDASLREEMRLEISQVTRQLGITAVYVTHDQREALALSDAIAVMNHGRIVQFGTPEEIYRSPADDFVARFVGYANAIPVQHRQRLRARRSGRQCAGDAPRELGRSGDRVHPCERRSAGAGDGNWAEPAPLHGDRRRVHGGSRRVRAEFAVRHPIEGAGSCRHDGIWPGDAGDSALATGQAHCRS